MGMPSTSCSDTLHDLFRCLPYLYRNAFHDPRKAFLRSVEGICIKTGQSAAVRSGFTEVVYYQCYLLGCVTLGIPSHAAGPEGDAEVRTSAYPEVQVAQRTAGGLRFGEVEHGKLRLPVAADFKLFQMSWV